MNSHPRFRTAATDTAPAVRDCTMQIPDTILSSLLSSFMPLETIHEKLTPLSLGTMKPSRCLRLARQSAISQIWASSHTGSSSVARTCTSQPRSLTLTPAHRIGVRTLSSVHDKNNLTRFSGAHGDGENVSPFKQHRRNELRNDQESEDPLYSDPYPRLDSSAARKAAPEFLDEFQDDLPSDEVTLTGRIRSKRVVGKSLIFLDIVNEFQKVQIMINKNKCVSDKQSRIQKFALFKNLIQVGDHICRPSRYLAHLLRFPWLTMCL